MSTSRTCCPPPPCGRKPEWLPGPCVLQGLPDYIDPTKPPKSYKDAMSLPDAAEWAEAYDKEYMGIKQRRVFEVVRIEKGMKLMGMTTRNEYKVVNGEFQKRKCRLCAMGNQQVEGSQFDARDL